MAITTLGANAIGDDAITTAKVADDAVTNAKIGAGAVTNTEATVEFDVSNEGKVINLKILSINPPRIHSRVILRGLRKAIVLPNAFGTDGNKVHVKYVQFKKRTEQIN